MEVSSLNNRDKVLAYKMQVVPRLTFPLVCKQLSRKDLAKVYIPALTVLMYALGLNYIFPRIILYGDTRYNELKTNNLYTIQGIKTSKSFIGFIRKEIRTRKLLQIERGYIEMMIGKCMSPLQDPVTIDVEWALESWITSLG